MLNLNIEKNYCSTQSSGSRLDCTREAIVGFIALTKIVANATNSSFDAAALFIYQQGVTAQKKSEALKNEKES